MIPLLILGLLKQYPGSYGYELLSLMDKQHCQYIVNYTKGSFYYNLQQLEDKNLIIKTMVVMDGKTTHHYSITEAGEEKFNQLMQKYGTKTDYVNLSFYLPFLFSGNYDEDAFALLIDQQIQQTEEKINRLRLALKNKDEMADSFAKMLENSVQHHLVNLQWFESLK